MTFDNTLVSKDSDSDSITKYELVRNMLKESARLDKKDKEQYLKLHQAQQDIEEICSSNSTKKVENWQVDTHNNATPPTNNPSPPQPVVKPDEDTITPFPHYTEPSRALPLNDPALAPVPTIPQAPLQRTPSKREKWKEKISGFIPCLKTTTPSSRLSRERSASDSGFRLNRLSPFKRPKRNSLW